MNHLAWCYALGALAVLALWALSGRRRDYLPVAAFFMAWFGSSAAWNALGTFVLEPLLADPSVAVPWTGWPRAAAHLGHALGLMGPAALVAASLVMFGERKPWPAVFGWAGTLAVFVFVHPRSGGSLTLAFQIADLLGTSISAMLFAAWFVRPKHPGTFAHGALATTIWLLLASAIAAFWVPPSEPLLLLTVSAIAIALVLLALVGAVWANTVAIRELRADVQASKAHSFRAQVAAQMAQAKQDELALNARPPGGKFTVVPKGSKGE